MRVESILQKVVTLVMTFAAAGAAQTTDNTPRDEVLGALRALDSAIVAGDVAGLSRLYADDYVFVNFRGETDNKQHQIALLKSATMKVTKRTPSEISVRTFGNAMAIVVFRRHQQTTVAGAARPDDVRVTDVWLKRNGNWQLVTGQVTPIQAP